MKMRLREMAASLSGLLGPLAPGKIRPRRELGISPELVCPILERNGVHPWFEYIYRERARRWDVWQPCRWIHRHLPAAAPVLETGCGVGYNLMWLAERGFQDLSGFDIDAAAIRAGREIGEAAGMSLRLWVDDGTAPRALSPGPFAAIVALNWTMYVPDFRLDPFLDLYLPRLAGGGALVFDAIDSSYDRRPNQQYLTSDWDKPPDQRQPSEYRVRMAETDVARAFRSRGLVMARIFRKEQAVPRYVCVARKRDARRLSHA